MSLEQMEREAVKRLNEWINRAVAQQRRRMVATWGKP